ncbi:MAG TPA: DUF6691 family protein [Thermoleophilaceae bacterium]|nr:DUF6691 family protein [Thermoleophilaceae bacterium]
MRARFLGLLIGLVFGIVLCWSGMISPVVIREALLFEDSYLFLFFAAAVATAAVGQLVLRRAMRTAVLTDQPVGWSFERPQRRHVVGSAIFGLGWGVADACPGPIATQVGQGIWWAVFTLAGVIIGVRLFLRRNEIGETEPPSECVAPLAEPALQQ